MWCILWHTYTVLKNKQTNKQTPSYISYDKAYILVSVSKYKEFTPVWPWSFGELEIGKRKFYSPLSV